MKVASLTVSNATLVFSNWNTCLTADDIMLVSNEVSCIGPFAPYVPRYCSSPTASNRIWLVCTNFFLGANAAVNLNGMGFSGAPSRNVNGYGPGGGISWSGSGGVGGGGHGGRGGGLYPYWGAPYDLTNAPFLPGSGGGADWSANPGRPGGGAMLIDAANDMIVNGVLSANGSNGAAHSGGSGGSIYLKCKTFYATNGVIQANGGFSTSANGAWGAGGRIAIAYDPAIQAGAPLPQMRISAGTSGGYSMYNVGTVFLPDTTWLTPGLEIFSNCWIHFEGTENWSATTLTLTNKTAIGFSAESGFALTVTDDVFVAVSNSLGLGGLNSSLLCAGSLRLTNDSAIFAVSGPTNGALTNYSMLVEITKDVLIGSNAWICITSATNGGSPLFVMSNLWIDSSGGFSADGGGFKGGPLNSKDGTGPGKGKGGSYNGTGAGHGGSGGSSSPGYGQTYGNSNAPITEGSGGGGGTALGVIGGDGGGVIRIAAVNAIQVNGTISANGGKATAYGSYGGGGGSGGGIFITCNSFAGDASGSVSANGGNAGSANGGAGGGGRVAIGIGMTRAHHDILAGGGAITDMFIYPSHAPYLGKLSAITGAVGTVATNGTCYFMAIASAASYSVTIAGNPGNYDSPAPRGYGNHLSIPAGTRITNEVTSPADVVDGTRHACLGWVLRDDAGNLIDSNFTFQAEFDVNTNLTLTWYWTNEFELVARTITNGTVNSNSVNGWYTNGLFSPAISAAPAPGYAFYEWTENAPPFQAGSNNIQVLMDRPRTILANFYSTGGEGKIWNGSNYWESATNWTPCGMAGPFDNAIINSGVSILDLPRRVKTLAVTNGAALVFTNWTTVLSAAVVAVRSAGRIGLAPAFQQSSTSNRIHIVCNDMLIETNAAIDADAGGYLGGPDKGDNSSGHGQGTGHGPGWGAYYGGASHGGMGAPTNSGGGVYGSSNAPCEPGSGGGAGWNWSGGHGGGGVRLQINNQLVLDGVVRADGRNAQGGGGSGGSIYISCGKIICGANGVISACGGNSSIDCGGGGGGRIAVEHGGGREPFLELVPPTFLGMATATNGAGPNGTGTVGTIKWFYSARNPGSSFIVR